MDAQKDKRDPARQLQRVTAAIGTEITGRNEIACAVLSAGVAALGATGGSIGVVDHTGKTVEIVAAEGYRRELVRQFRRMSIDFRAPLTDAARTGDTVIYEDPVELDAHYPELRRLRKQEATYAFVASPLQVGDETFGAIGFTFEAPRVFSTEEREFIAALANLSAQVLDRIERQRQHDRVARLQDVTAELAKAAQPEDIGRVVVDEVLAVLGADAGRILTVDPHTGERHTLAFFGYPETIVDRLPLPGDKALAQERPILIESLAEVDEPWADELRGAPVHAGACAAFPLRAGSRVLGAIGFAWHEEREFTVEDVDFLGSLANVCAQSLERAYVYDDLRQLLDRLGEAVLVLDRDLHVAYANCQAHNLLGRRLVEKRPLPETWRGVKLRDVVSQFLQQDRPWGDEARIGTSDGRVYAAIVTRERDGIILILRDVTRRERQEQAEREFIANAAHELRTPLTGIATAADALERGAKDIASERDYFIGGIVSEVNRLVRLSDALLVLARVQAEPGSLRRERIPLQRIVTRVASELDVKSGVRVRVDVEDFAVTGDASLLEGALSNVARNASQHTDRGEIAFEAHTEDDEVVLEVADTGRGMDEALRARATERFFRGDHDDRGFGLGLPMAKEMVRALGGALEIDTRKRGGTVVRLRLPVK